MFWRQLVLGCAHVCVCVLSCALSLSLSCVSLGFNESGACLLYMYLQGGASDKMHDNLCRNAHLRNCEIVT